MSWFEPMLDARQIFRMDINSNRDEVALFHIFLQYIQWGHLNKVFSHFFCSFSVEFKLMFTLYLVTHFPPLRFVAKTSILSNPSNPSWPTSQKLCLPLM